MTTTWHIANLEHEISDGYVFTAHWTVSASEPTGETDDNGDPTFYSAGAYGSVGFARPDNLIPYEDLTEDLVIEWVKEAISPEQVALIEANLTSQIDLQKNPKSAPGVPWSTEA